MVLVCIRAPWVLVVSTPIPVNGLRFRDDPISGSSHRAWLLELSFLESRRAVALGSRDLLAQFYFP